MNPESGQGSRRDVHLFVLDTMADWEPALAIGHINRPAPGMPSGYRVRTVGLDRTPIRSMGGLAVTPDLALSEVVPKESAMLILPGAELWTDAPTHAAVVAALAKTREFVDAGVPVAAICGATFGLARAGWLASSGYGGAALYVQEPAVEDRGVITASVTASVELARLILGRLEVFPPRALDAWYGLHKTGNPAYFFQLMEALGHGRPQ
jgi:putative intracellular protease/amidase